MSGTIVSENILVLLSKWILQETVRKIIKYIQLNIKLSRNYWTRTRMVIRFIRTLDNSIWLIIQASETLDKPATSFLHEVIPGQMDQHQLVPQKVLEKYSSL